MDKEFMNRFASVLRKAHQLSRKHY